jgi:multiple sugar transport system ATP-binding protein
MGDRVAVMKDGVLQQVDTPRALYERPANVFVAGFIGSPAMNLLELKIVTGGVQFGTGSIKVDSAVLGKTKAKTVTVGLRPEDLVLTTKGNGIAVEIQVIEELGADAFLYGNTTIEGKKIDIIARVDAKNHPNAGETVHLIPQGGITHLFDITSGLRLNNDVAVAVKAPAAKKAAAKPVAKKAVAEKPAVKKVVKPAAKKAAPKKAAE